MRSKVFPLLFVAVAASSSAAPLIAEADEEQKLRCFRIGVPAGIGATHVFMDMTIRVFATAHLCVIALRLPQLRLTGMIEGDELDGAILPGPIGQELRPLLLPVATPLVRFTGMLYWPADQPEPRGASSTPGTVLGQDWAHDEVARRGFMDKLVKDYAP